jgi:hypothetical protein
MPKQKVNKLITEIKDYDLEIIKGVVTKKLIYYEMEDLTTLPTEIKEEIHFLYDILFFIMECKHKAEYNEWVYEWIREDCPCRYEISGKYKLKKAI